MNVYSCQRVFLQGLGRFASAGVISRESEIGNSFSMKGLDDGFIISGE